MSYKALAPTIRRACEEECPTYLNAKGKVFATTLSDSDGSNSDSEESCDEEGNYSAFMAITPMDSSKDLSLLVEKLGEHTEVKSMGIGEESDNEDEGVNGLQESYNSFLKKIGEYARVAKAAIRKMKKVEQDYKSILVRYKETKCEVKALNEELTEAYSQIKFLVLEVIQANAKVERVASKKLYEVLTHQKPFSNKSGLGYTGKSSPSVNVSKEMKFVKAKEPMVETPSVKNVKVEKKPNGTVHKVLTKPQNAFVVKPNTKGKSLLKSQ